MPDVGDKFNLPMEVREEADRDGAPVRFNFAIIQTFAHAEYWINNLRRSGHDQRGLLQSLSARIEQNTEITERVEKLARDVLAHLAGGLGARGMEERLRLLEERAAADEKERQLWRQERARASMNVIAQLVGAAVISLVTASVTVLLSK